MDETEIDTPWFDPEWLLDHPDFPLSHTLLGDAEYSTKGIQYE